MLNHEIYTVARPSKQNPLFSITWAYPNTYQIGMCSLGYQLVWWLMEQDTDVTVNRAFLDSQNFRSANTELVGFTLSWELDYVNVLKILQELNVQQLASNRLDDEPLIFGGGPVLSANPEPFADFFDLILLGDAEAIIPNLLEAFKQARKLQRRQDKLAYLAEVKGVYVPSHYKYVLSSKTGPIDEIQPINTNIVNKPQKLAFIPPENYVAHSVMLAPEALWANTFLVEVARSCPQECRFCLASFLTRPFRATKINALLEAIDLGLKYTNRIGLLGPSVTEHPDFDELAQALISRPQINISIASVRADSLNELILNMLFVLHQKSITIAIESGSERLRTIMKKSLSETQIWQAVDLVSKSGLSAIKFYGIVGLPNEEQMDLDETIRLLSQLKRSYKHLKFTFGISSFVPKAQTPFQWATRDSHCKEKLEYLRKHLSKLGIEIRAESHNWSDIQTLLSRGDRRLTPMLLAIANTTHSNVGAWKKAFRQTSDSCPPADFYIHRTIPYNETLPWSHITDTPKLDMLKKHNQAAESVAHLTKEHLTPVT